MTFFFIFLCLLLSPMGSSYAAYFEPMLLGLEDVNYYFEGQSGASWGDFDSDGLLDLVVTASSTGYIGYAKILRNNGTAFEDTNANIPQVAGQLAQWGDFDNDGDLDLLLGGNWEKTCGDTQPTYVIRNDGGGVWTTVAQLPHLCFAAGEWADFDNDGYLDIGLTGSQNLTLNGGNIFELFTKLFRNEKGTGTFTPLHDFLPALSRSDINFGDYDNDGWLDVALSGLNQTTTTYGPELSGVFRNNQGTSFVPQVIANAAFSPRGDGTITWADYNADGWLDLILVGFHNHSRSSPTLYVNQEGQGFSETLLSNLEVSSWATVEWGDYDNDGYPDFCYFGFGAFGGVYKNFGGTGYFNRTELIRQNAGGVACVWGDYNNDGRLDLFVIGFNLPNDGVYVNTGATPATPPPPPTSVSHKCSNSQLHVQWERPSEGTGSLTYNVAVESGGTVLHVASMAMEDGRRLVPRMGNAQTRTFFNLEGVDCSIDFKVKVQTIDASFRGSTFASSSKASSASTLSSFFLQLLF